MDPGQYEATWEYDDVIQSIDNYINFKDFVKTIMRDNNYFATFMPKPFDHLPGNGLHIHLSLWDNNNKEISCSENNEFPLSELGSHFVSRYIKQRTFPYSYWLCVCKFIQKNSPRFMVSRTYLLGK